MGGVHQLDLLAWKPRGPFITEPDVKRLAPQMQRVFDCLKDGRERTLSQISGETGDPPASCSARFRDLKRLGFKTEHRNLGGGLWTYRLIIDSADAVGRSPALECARTHDGVAAP